MIRFKLNPLINAASIGGNAPSGPMPDSEMASKVTGYASTAPINSPAMGGDPIPAEHAQMLSQGLEAQDYAKLAMDTTVPWAARQAFIQQAGNALTQGDLAQMAADKTLPWKARLSLAIKANQVPNSMKSASFATSAMGMGFFGAMLTAGQAIGALQTMFTGKIGPAPDTQTASPEGQQKTLSEWILDPQFVAQDPQVAAVAPIIKKANDAAVVDAYYKYKTQGQSFGRDDMQQWQNQEISNLQSGRYRHNRGQEMGLPEWYKAYITHGDMPEFMKPDYEAPVPTQYEAPVPTQAGYTFTNNSKGQKITGILGMQGKQPVMGLLNKKVTGKQLLEKQGLENP